MTTYTFAFTGPRRWAERKGTCPTCGKRVTRKRMFQHTASPFNRNKDTGLPKTWAEVAADVDAERDAWVPDFEHAKCAEQRRAGS